MKKVELFCDICEKPLTETLHAVDDNKEIFEYQKHEVYTTLKQDTKKIFPHLCKRCAEKLDYLFEKLEEREDIINTLMKKRLEINEKRKNFFKSNG